MTRRPRAILLCASLLAILSPGAEAAGPVDLSLAHGPAPGDVDLLWVGGEPEYRVYGSVDPASVLDPGNFLGETFDLSWVDTPPPGGIFFYKVEYEANCFAALEEVHVNQASPDVNFDASELLELYDRDEQRWIYLKFALHDLPAGAVIDAATLHMALQDNPSRELTTELLEVPREWREARITWNDQPPVGGTIWASSSKPPQTIPGWMSWDVSALIQDWTNGTPNFGIMVRTDDTGETDALFRKDFTRLCIDHTPPRTAALKRLREAAMATGSEARVMLDGRDRAELVVANVDGDPALGTDPVVQALNYLIDYKDLYGLTDPQSEVYVEQIGEGANFTTVRFGQRHIDENLGVYGPGLAVAVQTSPLRILRTLSTFHPDLPAQGEFRIGARQAQQLALAAVPANSPVPWGEPSLLYFEQELVSIPGDAVNVAWRVGVRGFDEITGDHRAWTTFVDATTGAVPFMMTPTEEPLSLKVFEVRHGDLNATQQADCWDNASGLSGQVWFVTNPVFDGETDDYPDSDPPDILREARTVHGLLHDTYDFVLSQYNFFGINNGIMPIVAVTEVTRTLHASGCNSNLWFASGWVTPDVVAHEFMHALDRNAPAGADLIYQFESGAIDESFADIFGTSLDPGNWTMAEGVPNGPIRDLSDPPSLIRPGRTPQPDHYKDFFFTNPDNDDAGVHINSGILNKVFYLLVAGGTHTGVRVDSIGRVAAENIFFWTHITDGLLPRNAGFTDVANALIASAYLHLRPVAEKCSLINALYSVGISPADANCDGVVDSGPDADGDGLYGTDNCPGIFNDNTDTDADGLGDACDTDIDGDGVDNSRDNCIFAANPGQADTNPATPDGEGDACDDSDGDGVLFAVDNCPNTFNQDQTLDQDGDGIGDACDPDIDGDGDNNNVDLCPLDPLPQLDTDFDNSGDDCDNCPVNWNFNQADLDEDGIGDVCDSDRDGDGKDNGDDNCPDVANYHQIDNDNDGIGLYCDGDEFRHLIGLSEANNMAILFQYVDITEPVVWPILPCDTLCPDWIPHDMLTTVQLTLSQALHVRIVDDRGFVVAAAQTDGTGVYNMEFWVDQEYSYLSPGLSALPHSGASATQRFEGRKYYLEMMAPAGSSPMTVTGTLDVDTTGTGLP